MQIRRPWTTKSWCESVVDPEWPFAYSKYRSQVEERKGRVHSNHQHIGHKCQNRGVNSKCHICEEIDCDKDKTKKCQFQIQGAKANDMSMNIPTVTDVPWAVGGSHRFDFGNGNTSHVCMYLSSVYPCQSSFGDDYSNCSVRCWGFNLPPRMQTPGNYSLLNGNPTGVWPNARHDFMYGVNSTPWTLPAPTQTWSFPKEYADHTSSLGISNQLLSSLNSPQGLTFTLAGNSSNPGFQDGYGSNAHFRNPEGVAVDHLGNVYVSDTGNHAIRVVYPSGRVQTLAGTGKAGHEDGEGRFSSFSSPSGIAVWRDWQSWPVPDPNDEDSFIHQYGNGAVVLFVADTGNHRIRKVSLQYKANAAGLVSAINASVECFSGLCESYPRAGYSDGTKEQSRFDSPRGLVVSSDGLIYVSDMNNHLIRVIDRFGYTRTFAGSTSSEVNVSDLSLEGCPSPCLTGVSGYQDGSKRNSKFSFPSGIALGQNESYLLVNDQNRIRRIDLVIDDVRTIAGGHKTEERDGYGFDASFITPQGLAIDSKGFIYISDPTSCRIRRLSFAYDHLHPLKCENSFASVMRPSGCSSYNDEIDSFGLKATPMSGSSYFNYIHRNISSSTLGYDFIGRGIKDCVGSPPPAETIIESEFLQEKLFEIREDPNEGTMTQVLCSRSCSLFPEYVYGTTFDGFRLYSESSSICLAAYHSGLLEDDSLTMINLLEQGKPNANVLSYFAYSIAAGERSVSFSEIATAFGVTNRMFAIERANEANVVVYTISGAPATLTESSCGYRDSIPAQGAKFKTPTGIATFANGTTDLHTNYVYIADRGNHAIRVLTAVCTFPCENGASCIGPDECQCNDGWQGIDCTIPLCNTKCSSRQICVAPNKCSCIPGYTGSDCREPLCVQSCENDGYCSSPDTCSCLDGWFDPNCTTPVCSQTCGNGGNCTSPNYCSCPIGWKGFDCRTPVCEQQCLNGGMCVAPNTCQCTPHWTGYKCNNPVCSQGFFEPYLNDNFYHPNHWVEYRPCNLSSWCESTNAFECKQNQLFLNGSLRRYTTSRSEFFGPCEIIEIRINATTWYQTVSENGTFSPHARYSNSYAFGLTQNLTEEWSPKFGENSDEISSLQSPDRQLVLAQRVNVTQGKYMCANGGRCIAPDVCACLDGWIGFDCRVPVCEQGYFRPGQNLFVKGTNDGLELEVFEKFLSKNLTHRLNPDGRGYSNPFFEVTEEYFVDESKIERLNRTRGGEPYIHADKIFQGGYECSIRAFTKWENPFHIFEHPNYYSRYMDSKVEDDEVQYTYWKDMLWGSTHQKTPRRILLESSLNISSDTPSSDRVFVYTDFGYIKDGYWHRTGEHWKKGRCIVEFKRVCDQVPLLGDKKSDPNLIQNEIIVQDPDISFRTRRIFDDSKEYRSEEWLTEDRKCIDHVIRGCYNNGTCVAPNVCECSRGWTGYDCTTPICSQQCLNNGNCTLPGICTCEKGWTGHDCSEPICAQECNNGGVCIAPDKCECKQWENKWRDGRNGGGVPLYHTPNGDPQMTGWTGYDCSTPICVQAEFFARNINPSSFDWSDLISIGRDGGAIIKNDGKSFQTGCGNDPLITGCCYGRSKLSNSLHTCFKCDKNQLIVNPHEVECPEGGLLKFEYYDVSDIPTLFKYSAVGDVRYCGSNLNPQRLRNFDSHFTSDSFLCNRFSWEQGDFIPNDRLLDDAGPYSNFEIGLGRHERVNYVNYIKNTSEFGNNWYTGKVLHGEGIFVCYNGGGCVAPDTCECRDGYTGYDCRTPVCRHLQISGEIGGCRNGGICVDKDKCECLKTPSLLWLAFSESERGFTGYEGSDCSKPICTQGYYDPTCHDSINAPGGQGCYRCHNGGLCIGPDECECSEGWSGYDCKTPVCVVKATSEIRKQLMTTDENKVQIFENDPCGLEGFDTRSSDLQGHCVMPNKCTCTCKKKYDSKLCRSLGGVHCKKPFKDRLSKYRNVLSANEIFGTRECSSGYEGLTNEDNEYISCHLKIYEPTFFVNHSVSLILFSFILIIILFRTSNRILRSSFEQESKIVRGNNQRSKQSINPNQSAFLFHSNTKFE